jgi:hypothetical protein
MAVLLFLTFAAWSMGSAVGSSPDEDFVLTSIWCGSDSKNPSTKYCKTDPEEDSSFLVSELVAKPHLCYVNQGDDFSASCQNGMAENIVSTQRYFRCDSLGRCNQPRYYFDTMRLLVGANIEMSVVKMRLLNSALAAVLISISINLNKAKAIESLIAWLVFATPFSLYLISSINSTAWAITATTLFSNSLSELSSPPTGAKKFYKNLCLLLFSVLLAISSRKETIYIFIFLLALFLITNLKNKDFAIRSLNPRQRRYLYISIFFAICAAIFGLATLFPQVEQIAFNADLVQPGSHILEAIIRLPYFILGYFGSWGLGWFDFSVPQASWLFSLQASSLILFSMLRRSKKALKLKFICFFSANLTLILLATILSGFQIGSVIQPRYFLPFTLGCVVLFTNQKTKPLERSVLTIVMCLATLSNTLALRATLLRYTKGLDNLLATSLSESTEWWWQINLSPSIIWILGSISFPVTMFSLYKFREQTEIA